MKSILILLMFLFSLSFTKTTFAQSSDYVLPYPAVMPGSKLYLLQEVKNSSLKYWYFGNFGQFTYNLKQTDKFLVEAKTLFEYKQYLLANKALTKSDEYFQRLPYYLQKAKEENKDISEKQQLLKNASSKHSKVLNSLKNQVPETFNWQPEKKAATELHLKKNIDNAIKIRRLL